MVSIANFEGRIAAIEDVLALAASGKFDVTLEVTEDDDLASVENGIILMLQDIKELLETDRAQKERLEQMLLTVREQQTAIRDLSTPVMEIWDSVLVLPIVGVMDTKRSMDMMNNLLQAIVTNQARCVILDITGVEFVDTKTADYLLKVVRAAGLLGTRCVLTGLSPAVAQTLVEIGADLSEVRTLRNLKDGLRDCLLFLRSKAPMARDA